MGIMEAKFENAQRVLETDLQSQMEKHVGILTLSHIQQKSNRQL